MNRPGNSLIQRIAGRGLRYAKRVVIGVIGGTVLLLGIALIFLPGPAFIVIPIGLTILATEFVWAKRLLRRAKEMFNSKKTPKEGK